jgi:hypothetical protein
MKEYIAAIWGWEKSWQCEYFQAKWDPQKRKIIQIEGQDAGVLVIENRDVENTAVSSFRTDHLLPTNHFWQFLPF